jgi:hypothetical protein
VAVTLGEVDAYRKAGVQRWFSDGDDPFEPIPEHASLMKVRQRADGGCGFLSPSGLCRIHEELGYDRKPITCRVFPLRFHPVEQDLVITASFACPSVLANDGATLASQQREIHQLYIAWKTEQPESANTVEFVAGRTLPAALLPQLRSVLLRLLDTPAPDGSFDVTVSLRRIASFVDDLSRRRVLQLPEPDLTQYFDVMSRHALMPDKIPPARPASALARLLFRGFLLAAMSVHLHLELRTKRSAVRKGLARLALHLHGIGPGLPSLDLRTVRRVSLDPADDDIRETATHYLRSVFGTLGTGRRPIVEEIAMAVALLNAACVFARMHAGRLNYRTVDGASFTQGLLQSADVTQADTGTLSRLLTRLSGGIDALYLFPASTI